MIPLSVFTLYENSGYKIEDYINAYSQYENAISLLVYSILTLEDSEYVANEVVKEVRKIKDNK